MTPVDVHRTYKSRNRLEMCRKSRTHNVQTVGHYGRRVCRIGSGRPAAARLYTSKSSFVQYSPAARVSCFVLKVVCSIWFTFRKFQTQLNSFLPSVRYSNYNNSVDRPDTYNYFCARQLSLTTEINLKIMCRRFCSSLIDTRKTLECIRKNNWFSLCMTKNILVFGCKTLN